MDIRTQGLNQWVVVAEWFGAERVVHGPCSVFECIRFRRTHA